MRKATTKYAAAAAGGKGALGTAPEAASSLQGFARRQAELKQMFLSHQRGLGTSHAWLPSEGNIIASKT